MSNTVDFMCDLEPFTKIPCAKISWDPAEKPVVNFIDKFVNI